MNTSHDIYLITPEEFELLPNGTALVDQYLKEYVKGKDYIDTDERCGLMAFGFRTHEEYLGAML